MMLQNATKEVINLVNSDKLKGKIKEQRKTIKGCAEIMGITPYTLGKKIANKKPFSVPEAHELQVILDIPDCDFSVYFFSR